jgi:alkaline phosphatase
VAAQGPQAAGVLGITDQTDLFHTMARALGLE